MRACEWAVCACGGGNSELGAPDHHQLPPHIGESSHVVLQGWGAAAAAAVHAAAARHRFPGATPGACAVPAAALPTPAHQQPPRGGETTDEPWRGLMSLPACRAPPVRTDEVVWWWCGVSSERQPVVWCVQCDDEASAPPETQRQQQQRSGVLHQPTAGRARQMSALPQWQQSPRPASRTACACCCCLS